jgi:hypothetical protein
MSWSCFLKAKNELAKTVLIFRKELKERIRCPSSTFAVAKQAKISKR